MQNPRKYTVLFCLLFILFPTIVDGEKNGEEPLAIYLDVGNEIQNVISLVNKHETKLNDFDDKLLRIQNMLENFEKEFSKWEQNCMAALDKRLQSFKAMFEQRLSSINTNVASSIGTQESSLQRRPSYHHHRHHF
ncbi:PREDICTED: uncharacterized protein LOC108967994 isoform X1 [Bactrocera latifrons]|uniref:uncharacterized protein LOC108967994 isoform X1 n=1 Tax=Bactrocera latifrons TaxID=174628 RepID=UPI0008DD9374|nr:PREDICTED: uncharacterized protein LOC108967994 isoform X1 [Bactrocera latifrons]